MRCGGRALGKARRFVVGCAALSTVLAGCEVSYPTQQDVTGVNRDAPPMLTVADARNYVAAARGNMHHQEDVLHGIEIASDTAVIGGGIAALAGGLLHYSSKFVV